MQKKSLQDSPLQIIKYRLRIYTNYLILGFVVLVVISLIRNILGTLEATKKIGKKEAEVAGLRKKNEELKKKLEEISSDFYIEKQIRDKLSLAKEGEIVVVLPPEDVLRSIVPELPSEEEELPDPIWRKWYKLFF